MTLNKELEEEEDLLKQCIQKLKVVEANRLALVSQLREALHEQVLGPPPLSNIDYFYCIHMSKVIFCLLISTIPCAFSGIRTRECSHTDAGMYFDCLWM